MNKYEIISNKVLKEVELQLGHNINIDSKRSTNPFSGRAYCETYTIKVPIPKSDISLYTFLHEIGHLVHKVKLSCLNEYRINLIALQCIDSICCSELLI